MLAVPAVVLGVRDGTDRLRLGHVRGVAVVLLVKQRALLQPIRPQAREGQDCGVDRAAVGRGEHPQIRPDQRRELPGQPPSLTEPHRRQPDQVPRDLDRGRGVVRAWITVEAVVLGGVLNRLGMPHQDKYHGRTLPLVSERSLSGYEIGGRRWTAGSWSSAGPPPTTARCGAPSTGACSSAPAAPNSKPRPGSCSRSVPWDTRCRTSSTSDPTTPERTASPSAAPEPPRCTTSPSPRPARTDCSRPSSWLPPRTSPRSCSLRSWPTRFPAGRRRCQRFSPTPRSPATALPRNRTSTTRTTATQSTTRSSAWSSCRRPGPTCTTACRTPSPRPSSTGSTTPPPRPDTQSRRCRRSLHAVRRPEALR